MIDPDDYQQVSDPVGWTCVRDPLPRWMDGIFNDYPTWYQRHEIIRDINNPEDPFALKRRLGQMNRDHLQSQWSVLNNDYDWEEIEIWPMDQFDRARQDNGARWSRHLRDDPLGEPWKMSATRWDHIRDLMNRINDIPRLLEAWQDVYDRDCRMWNMVYNHWQEHSEPLVMTRREFQSRRSWSPVPPITELDWDIIQPRLPVPD